MNNIDDIKSKLFISLAAGRFICGLLALTGILFLAWVVEVIGKDWGVLSEHTVLQKVRVGLQRQASVLGADN